MKKNNKKGFTLVELIIVATIMVMIMGAILNWIRPMNKFYQRTQSLADTNDIGSLLMDYVDDELRYATNVVVLQGYEGVPELKGQCLMNSSGNASINVKFTNVLILDSNPKVIRGSRFADYVADSTVARRKGAYGCILKANISNDGIETDKMSCLGTEPLYNDYGCSFEASMNALENGSSCVTINMELTRPKRDGATYKFDQFGYNQSRDFELVNVNLKKNDGMRADFYTTLGEAPNMDYYKFAKASDPGTNPNATSMYIGGPEGTFTYILYTKTPVKPENVKINLYEAPGSTLKLKDYTLNSGESIPESVINEWISYGESYYTTEWTSNDTGTGYTRTKFIGIRTSGDEPIEEYKTKGVISPIDFFIKTAPENRPLPTSSLKFMDRFDDGRNDLGDYIHPRHEAGIWEDDHIVSGVPDGVGDQYGKYSFVGWLRKSDYEKYSDPSSIVPPSTDPDDADSNRLAGWFVEGQEYFSSDEYVAVYKENAMIKLEFVQTTEDGGNNFGTVEVAKDITADKLTNDSRIGSVTNDASVVYCPAGKVFKQWNILDPSDGSVIGQVKADIISTLDPTVPSYTVVADYRNNTYPDTFEITINIGDQVADWRQIQISNPDGSPAVNVSVVHESDAGTTVLQENVDIYYYPIDKSKIMPHDTIRIYAKAPVRLVVGDNRFDSVSSELTLNYNFDPSTSKQTATEG
jgi:prepilin-type N-terminal cleavage/methylation domain-containing protein